MKEIELGGKEETVDHQNSHSEERESEQYMEGWG